MYDHIRHTARDDRSRQIVFCCEHASNFVPKEFSGLGLRPDHLSSHIAWDIGAAGLAIELSRLLDAPLVAAPVSRLVYDCNRHIDAFDAIVEESDGVGIPGNENLNSAQREQRVREYYLPFHRQLETTLERAGYDCALVTIHSFTPVYKGQRRDVEIGVLHDSHTSLADALLRDTDAVSHFDVRRNEPYAASDGVTHTLQRHGVANAMPNVMLEIRNDLIASLTQQRQMAVILMDWLKTALGTMVPK